MSGTLYDRSKRIAMRTPDATVVIPAKNEARNLEKILPELKELSLVDEVIVVDDGSEDDTSEVAKRFDAVVVSHPESMGNGASIKAGARKAGGKYIVFMDGDGQHRPEEIPDLLDGLFRGYADMVVGARTSDGQASFARKIANRFYNWFASIVTGYKIKDLTSGFRAVDAAKFRSFLNLLPNGFSYPATSTMAFIRSGYVIQYKPVDVRKREGKSHIKPVRDGARFLIIIFKIATLYSPLKVFIPIAALSVGLGIARYVYTFATMHEFTNMSALLLVTGVQIFLIGLVSEQITTLLYQSGSHEKK
jgi:glycosyltransferase involved in cell wall biosynthesis